MLFPNYRKENAGDGGNVHPACDCTLVTNRRQRGITPSPRRMPEKPAASCRIQYNIISVVRKEEEQRAREKEKNQQ